jgi:diacylglycerol kinase family enzyme
MGICLEEKISVIINMQAGNGNKEIAAHAEKICAPYSAQAYPTNTLIGMKQRVLSSLNNGSEMFVIVGGDGTLAAAINLISNYCDRKKLEGEDYKKPKIAYIPAGTGNLLKTLIDIDDIEDPLSLLIKKYESKEIVTRPYDLVQADFLDANSGEKKSLFYTMMGCGMDAALLQDFESICRGKFGFFSSGKMGYARSIACTTIPREIISMIERYKIKGDVRITATGDVKQIVARGKKNEILLNAHKTLYEGRQADLHTVLAATTQTGGFGVVAFPHLNLHSQFKPQNSMQVRILNGNKLNVVGHLIGNIPKILFNNYRNSDYMDDYLVGEGSEVKIEYENPCALQVGGDFISEVSQVKFRREGSMELVNWGKLAGQ